MEKITFTECWRQSLVVLLVCLHPVFLGGTKCPKGQILYSPPSGKPEHCINCESGETFMPIEGNDLRLCNKCTRVVNPDGEELVSPCNRTHDSVIRCLEGYFRTNNVHPTTKAKCQKCTECDHLEIRHCEMHSDTVCCPHPANDSSECVFYCGVGQLLDPQTGRCSPCPLNTYMDLEKHAKSYCINCTTISANENLHPSCNNTHPEITSCVEGFYRRPAHGYPTGVCIPCTGCSQNTDGHVYEGRACNHSQDTVCCSQPDMWVVDAFDGPNCLHTRTEVTQTEAPLATGLWYCGEGEYIVLLNESSQSTSCLPCPSGTYMDQANHTRNVCHHCAEVFDLKHCIGTLGVWIGLAIGGAGAVLLLLGVFMVTFRLWRRRRGKKEKAGYDIEYTDGRLPTAVIPLILTDVNADETETASEAVTSSDLYSAGESAYIDVYTSESDYAIQSEHMYEEVD